MTDEANASAAAGVPIEPDNSAPNPVETSRPAERPSLDDVLDKAFAEAEKREATKAEKVKAEPEPKEPAAKPAKTESKPTKAEPAKAEPVKAAEPVKDAAQRGEDGKFLSTKSKEEEPRRSSFEAPSRFHETARAEWDKAPESVKGEVHRALKEAESGIQKYKSDAEAYGQVKDYADMATKHGTNIRTALDRYVGLEMALTSGDPGKQEMGIAEVFRVSGVNPRDWAAKVLGQTPDQIGATQHKEITALHAVKSALERENAGLKAQLQDHTVNASVHQVQSFAAEHPRLNELADDIAIEIKLLRQADPSLTQEDLLALAYKRADRFNPSQTAPLTPAPTDPAHTRTDAGQKSITGAPASGSDPAIPPKRKGKSPTIDDALDRAFARVAS